MTGPPTCTKQCPPPLRSASSISASSLIGEVISAKNGDRCNSAFNGCTMLVSVQLNEGLRSIGCHAFESCTSLESIVVPFTVKYIGIGAFPFCTQLANVELNVGLESIDNFAFEGCKSLVHFVVPPSVSMMNCGVLINCTNLKNVVLYEGLEVIEQRSFAECLSLESVMFPSSVKTLGENAFRRCSNLANVELNEGLRSIGYYAFDNCTSLAPRMLIPSTINLIGRDAFKGCPSLVKVQFRHEIEELVSETSLQVWWNHGLSDRALRTFCFLSKASIPERLGMLHQMKWRLAIDDMLGHIRSIETKEFAWLYGGHDKLDNYFCSIDFKLTFYENLKEAATLLELALWKSKLIDQSFPSNDDNARTPNNMDHRFTCGADVIIPKVLSFILDR